MASSYQDLLTAVWDAIENDSGTSFVAASTPFFADLIPATAAGSEFTARFTGGDLVSPGTTAETSHELVVEVLADTSVPKTGQAVALSYATSVIEILAGECTDILGHHQARVLGEPAPKYEIETAAEGEWSIVRLTFNVTQIAALES